MVDIKTIYNYFNESTNNDKHFLELKPKVLDDHFNYVMYKESYDDKTYKLSKIYKTNTKYFKMYLEARKEMDNYIKNANDPDINITLNCYIDALEEDYQHDYAKYYLFRLLIERELAPYYTPCNSNLIIEGRKLLNYFASINHKAIISGQHTQTIPQEELSHIKKITGFYPKLVGYELLACSKNINPNSDKECLEEVEDNKGTLQVALYDKKSILTFTWHMFSPLYGCGKSFYSEHTEFDIRKIFDSEESDEFIAYVEELNHMAGLLKHFLDAKKPILFRPFHEADGTWFWWGKYGVEYAKRLYQFTYDYLTVEKGLNNLIWVWNSIGDYPGDEYVDIISVDVYENIKGDKSYADIYKKLVEKVSDKKLVALAECDKIPSIAELEEANFPFIYYMTWSKEFCLTEKYNTNEFLKEFYHDKHVIKEK
jgi:mannan endo-1,4-beta-mannosidase